MKKYLPYIIIILLLAGAAAWLILNKTSGTDDLSDKAFAVENTKSITKIILTNTDKKRIELNNTNGVWMLNGKYAAREELIQSLLECMQRVTVLSPVPRAGHDNVIRQMMAQNVKVEVYTGKEQQPIKTFYVGGPTPDATGTYMVLEADGKLSSRPYIVYIPGLRAYLTPRFSTDEENWRTKVLYNYKEDDIKSLSVEYPAEEKKSFIINRLAKDSFEMLPKDEKNAIHQHYEQKYIQQYLGFYSSVYIEAFDNNYSLKDSMMQTIPYCIITITEKDSAINKVKLFYMPVSERSKMQYDKQGNVMTRDIEHFHAAIHDNKDFAIVQYYVFGKLLRSYQDFFFKPGAEPATNRK